MTMLPVTAVSAVVVTIFLLVATTGASLDVHIIPHSHCDVGYVKTFEDYYATEVKYIINTVLDELTADATKRFVWSEQVYFQLWWRAANETQQERLRRVVASGQWEFIGGGMVMNDEAVCHYQPVINQMTEGHLFIQNTFGVRPLYGWCIDPFGSSSAIAQMWALMGFNAHVTRRINWAVALARKAEQELEFVWHGVECAPHDTTDLFTHILALTYSSPAGFDFQHSDAVPVTSATVEKISDELYAQILLRSTWFRTNSVMVPCGGDFEYQNATVNFSNMSLVIDYINANPDRYDGARFHYSTLGEYMTAIHDDNATWPTYDGDFLPYTELPDTAWSGFFSSRPALKGLSRLQDSILRSAEMLFALGRATFPKAIGANSTLTALAMRRLRLGRYAQSILQHHDAITGTEKEVVLADYNRHLGEGIEASWWVTKSMLAALLGKPAATAEHSAATASAPDARVTIAVTDGARGSGGGDEGDFSVSYHEVWNALASGHGAPVVVFNSLAWDRTQYLSIPVPSTAVAVHNSTGAVPCQTIVQGANATQLFFAAQVGPLGISTYYVVPANHSVPACPSVVAAGVDATYDGPLTISNDVQTIAIDAATHLIANLTWHATGNTSDFAQQFLEYQSLEGSAYIFRIMSGPTAINAGKPPKVSIAQGPLVAEIVQEYTDAAISLTTRLYASLGVAAIGALIEMDNTVYVDATDLGTNVVTRFTTGVANGGAFVTDDSGWQLRDRLRDDQVSLPESFYPAVTTGMLGPSGGSGSGAVLAVMGGRTHGCSSAVDGSLEFMLHRRMLQNGFPPAGLGQPLNDTTTIHDRLFLTLMPGGDAPDVRTALVYYLNNPLEVFYGKVDGATWRAKYSAAPLSFLSGPLPPSVHLLTLQALNETSPVVQFRLANVASCGAGDNATATVDVSTLFAAPLAVSSLEERTLNMVIPIEDLDRWQWQSAYQSAGDGGRANEECDGDQNGAGSAAVTLDPMSIRSYFLEF